MKRLLALVLLSSSVFAGTPSLAKQQDRLTRLMVKWQDKLHMGDLVIDLKVVPKEDLDRPGLAGSMTVEDSDYYPGHAEIHIKILQTSDYPAGAGSAYIKKDQRNTVVHELIHVLLAGFDEETFVEVIADKMMPVPSIKERK